MDRGFFANSLSLCRAFSASLSFCVYLGLRYGRNRPSLALGFYEAEFVKPRGEFSFLFSFWLSFIRIWQQFIRLALVLDRCGARHERRKDQTPKPVTLSSSQRNWLKRATEYMAGARLREGCRLCRLRP